MIDLVAAQNRLVIDQGAITQPQPPDLKNEEIISILMLMIQ